MKTKLITLFLLLLYPAFLLTASAQTVDSWADTSAGTFKWETASDWSLGVPPSIAQSSITITNVSVPMPHQNRQKTVEIDSTTAVSFPGTMTISNLTVSAPTFNENTLLVSNTGSIALHILHGVSILSHGIISVNNSTLQTDAGLSDDGTLLIDNGAIVGTNAGVEASIGDSGAGQATINSGTWLSNFGFVIGNGGTGTLTINGGTVQATGTQTPALAVGVHGIGTVWLSGGLLDVPANVLIDITLNGSQMTVSNGTWHSHAVAIGDVGTLTIAGGTNDLESPDPNLVGLSAGNVWVTGGNLFVGNSLPQTNVFILGGTFNAGQMTVSNGIVQLGLTNGFFGDMYIGRSNAFQGTLTIAGGVTTLSAALLEIGGKSMGTVWVTDGLLNVPHGLTVVGDNGLGQMTVSNGTMQINNLELGASGGSGTLTVAGGTNTIFSTLTLGSNAGAAGAVWITGGQLTATNDITYVGYGILGGGQLTVSNGTYLAGGLYLGYSDRSQGTLTVAGGTTTANDGLLLGVSSGATGTVWMTGGQLITTSGSTIIGNNGVGHMTVSNGLWEVSSVLVNDSGDGGTLTIAGGTVNMPGGVVFIAINAGTTGTVWMTGGQLVNNLNIIGQGGVGRMVVSNGTLNTSFIGVANGFDVQGSLMVAGGTNSVYGKLIIGTTDCSSTGSVTVAGGNLFVTNALGNAVLDLENGTFTLNSGTVVVNTFVMTNACAHFVRTGGTLIYSNAVLNPNFDADGDGIPNGYEQVHGLDPLQPSDANLDNDGDGFSNLLEYQAGTDPNNSSSTPFRIASVVQQGNDVLLTWTTAGGKTNVVQATKGSVGGSYSNDFTDLSSTIVPTGTGLTSTNYLDFGGATNKPSRFYRVRLVP